MSWEKKEKRNIQKGLKVRKVRKKYTEMATRKFENLQPPSMGIRPGLDQWFRVSGAEILPGAVDL